MNGISRLISNLEFTIRHAILRFREDCRGVAALEFALIAPIMIMLFVGTLEVSAAVSVNRKVSRISSVIGDLVTQSTDLSASDIANIMDVSQDIMEPYSNTVKIRITGINIVGTNATVASSCHENWSKLAIGSPYTVPAAIKTDGTFLVAARVQTNYQPMVGWARYSEAAGISFDNTSVTMDEEIFLRPRIGASVNMNC